MHIRMKGKRKNAVCLAAAILLTCCMMQTIDCYRLKKTERRKEADAAKTIGVQEGEIVFGRVFQKGSGLESQVKKLSSNASNDEVAYQADFAGWSEGQTHDANPKEASWKRMAPSLHCGNDQLKFRAMGPEASQFAVEQENTSPLPLSQIPSTCGYNMQKNPLGLVMLVPYDGCNVVQEGGSYVLPMRWQGIPVSLWCPKPASTAATTAAQVPQVHQVPQVPQVHQVPQVPQVHQVPQMPQVHQVPQMPQVHQVPQMPRTPRKNPQVPHTYYLPPYMYGKHPSATATTTTKQPQVHQLPQYHHPYQHIFPYYPLPVTTAAPTTTVKPSTAFPFVYPYIYPPFPWLGPLAPTTKPPTTTAKPQVPKYPYVPLYPPYPFPFVPPYPMYPTQKPTTTTATTKPPVTAYPPYVPIYPPYPFPFVPPYPIYPTQKPTTKTPTTAKPSVTPYPPYIPIYPPYPFPLIPPKPTTQATTAKPVQPTVMPHHHPHGHLHFPFVPVHG